MRANKAEKVRRMMEDFNTSRGMFSQIYEFFSPEQKYNLMLKQADIKRTLLDIFLRKEKAFFYNIYVSLLGKEKDMDDLFYFYKMDKLNYFSRIDKDFCRQIEGRFREKIEVIQNEAEPDFVLNLIRVSADHFNQKFLQYSVCSESQEDSFFLEADVALARYSQIISYLHCFANKSYDQLFELMINAVINDFEEEILVNLLNSKMRDDGVEGLKKRYQNLLIACYRQQEMFFDFLKKNCHDHADRECAFQDYSEEALDHVEACVMAINADLPIEKITKILNDFDAFLRINFQDYAADRIENFELNDANDSGYSVEHHDQLHAFPHSDNETDRGDTPVPSSFGGFKRTQSQSSLADMLDGEVEERTPRSVTAVPTQEAEESVLEIDQRDSDSEDDWVSRMPETPRNTGSGANFFRAIPTQLGQQLQRQGSIDFDVI